MKKPSKICSLLFPKSSIIFLVLMGIAFSKPNSISESLDLPEWIMVMSVVFIICVIPYDLIRWLLWGRNKYYRKCSQYEKAYHKNQKRVISDKDKARQKANQLIEEAKEYCDIVSKTTDRNIFEHYLERLKTTLVELTAYEKYNIFPGVTPTEDLDELLIHEDDLRETFEERLLKRQLHSFEVSLSCLNKKSSAMSDEELRRFALKCNYELEKEDEREMQ